MSGVLDDGSRAVLAFHPLILFVRRRVLQSLSDSVRRRVGGDALYVAGQFGAWKAVECGGWEKESPYVAASIRGAMVDWLRSEGFLLTGGATRRRFAAEKCVSQLGDGGCYLGAEDERACAQARVDAALDFAAVLATFGDEFLLRVLRVAWEGGDTIQGAAMSLGCSVGEARRAYDAVLQHVEREFGGVESFRENDRMGDLAVSLGWKAEAAREVRRRAEREYRQRPHVREARRLQKARARRRRGVPERRGVGPGVCVA